MKVRFTATVKPVAEGADFDAREVEAQILAVKHGDDLRLPAYGSAHVTPVEYGGVKERRVPPERLTQPDPFLGHDKIEVRGTRVFLTTLGTAANLAASDIESAFGKGFKVFRLEAEVVA